MLAQTGRLPPPTRSAIDKRANAAFFAPKMTDDMPRTVRNLLRGLDRASLASALPAEPGTFWPYVSLVLVAVDHDLAPILLLSEPPLDTFDEVVARRLRPALYTDAGVAAAIEAVRRHGDGTQSR